MFILDNFIYIYHLDKFCVLPTMPDSITDQMNSSFNSTNALSRSAPVWSYANSGPRSVTFNLELHRDIMEDINKNVSNLKDNVIDFTDADYIDVLLNYLQACALPKYNVYKTGSKVVEPPQVAIKMGKDIFIRGVINGGVSVSYKKPILDNGRYANATVSFTVTEVDPYDAPTVAMVGGFRGVTATFKSGIYKDDSDTTSYNGQEFSVTAETTERTTYTPNTHRWDYSRVKVRQDTQKVENGNKNTDKDPVEYNRSNNTGVFKEWDFLKDNAFINVLTSGYREDEEDFRDAILDGSYIEDWVMVLGPSGDDYQPIQVERAIQLGIRDWLWFDEKTKSVRKATDEEIKATYDLYTRKNNNAVKHWPTLEELAQKDQNRYDDDTSVIYKNDVNGVNYNSNVRKIVY